MSVAPLPCPAPAARPAATGAGAFFRTLVGELRAATAAASSAKPRIANDNDGRHAFA